MSANNICNRCEKRVYPIEELKCLDKVWHKTCFKCQGCGMTLNLKTYKGYNKLPYCNAHVPQVKYTAVADTPEARRLAENTRIQSNIKYHQDFEKLKGKVTQVADDPETLRILNSSKMISNAAYHGEFEKKKQMEEKRSLLPDATGVSLVTINQVNDTGAHKVGSIAEYDPMNDRFGSIASGYRRENQTTLYYNQPLSTPNVMGQQAINNVGYRLPSSKSFRAMYDYTAQDNDEVSFREGDLIINCQSIDQGWMTGTVQRTGMSGMLPANYVEPYSANM
ncbi:LIM and SH3 domain protein F42H10.3 [Tetranychus urticae]|uniref:SH3 domain-containing protein n=1 Tax=Tetranychus urticae TaxID=32264 RepID=T1L1P3_TETUR|nr:LIM and SH3 domain protein F42H10.3 [Tetranychus urticae]